ncbi:MAG: hypothetical protein HYX68_17985 [Planctomycetes bacterium]|nr:hypothetical protein [Planctomycetota bacterium]
MRLTLASNSSRSIWTAASSFRADCPIHSAVKLTSNVMCKTENVGFEPTIWTSVHPVGLFEKVHLLRASDMHILAAYRTTAVRRKENRWNDKPEKKASCNKHEGYGDSNNQANNQANRQAVDQFPSRRLFARLL